MVGSKDIVKYLGREFIRDVDCEDLAEGILKYFDLSLSEKEKISKKAKEIAKKFNEEICIEVFKVKFMKILEYLNT